MANRDHSWRASTFAALRHAALETSVRWPGYAEFATLQEQGLRRQALAALRVFAADLDANSHEARWGFVVWLFGTYDFGSEVVLEALAPHPLRKTVILKALLEERTRGTPLAFLLLAQHWEWAPEAATEPGAPAGSLLREGLALHPEHQGLRSALARHLLGIVEFNAHHLFESKYLGSPEEDLLCLDEAQTLLSDQDAAMRTSIDGMRALLGAWVRFLVADVSDFPAWCRANGVEAPSGFAVYYET